MKYLSDRCSDSGKEDNPCNHISQGNQSFPAVLNIDISIPDSRDCLHCEVKSYLIQLVVWIAVEAIQTYPVIVLQGATIVDELFILGQWCCVNKEAP